MANESAVAVQSRLSGRLTYEDQSVRDDSDIPCRVSKSKKVIKRPGGLDPL